MHLLYKAKLVVTRLMISATGHSAIPHQTPRSSNVAQRHGNALVSAVTTVDVRGCHETYTGLAGVSGLWA
jgi:hypothetical protein